MVLISVSILVQARSSSECGHFWSDSGSLWLDADTILMCGGCESARRWFVAGAFLV